MCDYSLYTIQNRLAEQGEELVLHKFHTGTLGFASASELEAATRGKTRGFWSILKDCTVARRLAQLPAICIPPGTRLLLTAIPLNVEASLRVACSEVVVFTELSDRSYSYRDAVVLPDGTRVLLQDLPEGIRAVVLSTSPEPSTRPANEEVYAA